MTKKTILILTLFFLILTSFSFAVKPTTITPSNSVGLQIEYPLFNYFKLNTNPLIFNFHVFNSTNFILTNSSVNCTIHLYLNNGSHLLNSKLTYDVSDNDFKYDLNTTNITSPQDISFLVNCNSPTEAGFIASGFRINTSGHDPALNTNYIAVTLFLIGICFILITISNNLDPRHGILKLILLSFVVLFFIVFGVVLLTMMRGGELDIHALLFFKTNTWLLRIFFSYVLIFLLVMVFEKLGMLVKVKQFFKVK